MSNNNKRKRIVCVLYSTIVFVFWWIKSYCRLGRKYSLKILSIYSRQKWEKQYWKPWKTFIYTEHLEVTEWGNNNFVVKQMQLTVKKEGKKDRLSIINDKYHLLRPKRLWEYSLGNFQLKTQTKIPGCLPACQQWLISFEQTAHLS